MVLDVSKEVNAFFRFAVKSASLPIQRALAPMVLAFLLAPHNRRLKTIAGMVAGHRVHVATISRRLVNPRWKTRDYYVSLYERHWRDTNQWERVVRGGGKRHWCIVIDTTYHSSVSRCMENMIEMSRRQDQRRRSKRQHAFLMGMILTDRGGRIPLPRRSYYTKAYCMAKGKKYRTLNQLAVVMLKEVSVPKDVTVTVTFDSAFDDHRIHRVCKNRGFREVFPIDPNRNLSASEDAEGPAIPDRRVVAWTRSWDCKEFELIELQVENEDFVYFRRRHVDNLRVKKTRRRYAVAARRATVSRLGECLIVASYKENEKVKLLPGQSASWQAYHAGPVVHRKESKKVPSRWHGKVLACTDPQLTAREVIQLYEVRWQVELLFRELKSRMQLGCYVLMKFEAVERYMDFLLMGLLLLEHQRLNNMKRNGPPSERAGEPWAHARVTDQLRLLEETVNEWNIRYIEAQVKTKAGIKRLLRTLRQSPCRVA